MHRDYLDIWGLKDVKDTNLGVVRSMDGASSDYGFPLIAASNSRRLHHTLQAMSLSSGHATVGFRSHEQVATLTVLSVSLFAE